MRTTLTDAGIPYAQMPPAGTGPAQVTIGERVVSGWNGRLDAGALQARSQPLVREMREALAAAGYPAAADTQRVRVLPVLAILVLMMLAATALYGPQAAALVELFPTRVRYTALSVPYNVGVGWVGGLLPVSAFALVAASGDIYAGLFYPLVFTLISIVCALLFLPETRGIDLERAGGPR
jgi:hypothetical protein